MTSYHDKIKDLTTYIDEQITNNDTVFIPFLERYAIKKYGIGRKTVLNYIELLYKNGLIDLKNTDYISKIDEKQVIESENSEIPLKV